MSLVLVRESPPNLCLDVADSETGLDMADTGINGIKGGLVYQMDVDARWVYRPCAFT